MSDTSPGDEEGFGDEGTTVPWSVFLDEAVTRLRSAAVASPEAEARWIVEECSGFEGTDFHLGLEVDATVRGVARFDRMMSRREAGEPLQYVLGHWAFRTLDLMVDSRVLIPRPETEGVVEVALRELDRLGGTQRSCTVVDLGTGSGAIALSIAAERPHAQVWGVDESGDALAVARANLAGLGRSGQRVRLAQGDWFAALPVELVGAVELVVANPPYVADDEELPAEVGDWEPVGALRAGPGGLEDVALILDEAPLWLTRPGTVVLELAPHQAEAATKVALAGFDEAWVEPDLSGRARALVARLA